MTRKPRTSKNIAHTPAPEASFGNNKQGQVIFIGNIFGLTTMLSALTDKTSENYTTIFKTAARFSKNNRAANSDGSQTLVLTGKETHVFLETFENLVENGNIHNKLVSALVADAIATLPAAIAEETRRNISSKPGRQRWQPKTTKTQQ